MNSNLCASPLLKGFTSPLRAARLLARFPLYAVYKINADMLLTPHATRPLPVIHSALLRDATRQGGA